MDMWECPRCDYTNKTFAVFLKHLHRKTPCVVISGKAATDPKEYASKLMDERHAKKRYPCPECDKKYSSAGSLRIHKMRKHGYHSKGKGHMPSEEQDDKELASALDELFDEPKAVNVFGQEDIAHLLTDTVSEYLMTVYKSRELTALDKFSKVVKVVFDDPEKPENKTYKVDNGKLLVYNGTEYTAPMDVSKALSMIKQRALTVMQNPMSFDDEPLADFVREVGETAYEELSEFTYKMDQGECVAETDNVIVETI